MHLILENVVFKLRIVKLAKEDIDLGMLLCLIATVIVILSFQDLWS